MNTIADMMRRTFNRIIKSKSGSTLVETALCLPVLLYMIFFIMELIRISILQIALDAVSIQAAFEYSGAKNTSSFRTIIDDTIPKFLMNGEIRTYLKVYPSVNAAVTGKQDNNSWTPNYGENVVWPNYDAEISRYGNVSTTPMTGNAFELTVVCNYRFTNSVAATIFGQKLDNEQKQNNTSPPLSQGRQQGNDKFLIWSRACAACS